MKKSKQLHVHDIIEKIATDSGLSQVIVIGVRNSDKKINVWSYGKTLRDLSQAGTRADGIESLILWTERLRTPIGTNKPEVRGK